MAPEHAARAVAIVMLGLGCTAAVAGPPFLTDDPEPVDRASMFLAYQLEL